jgi:tetratricopeptide (TPR) repeat protein
MNLLLRTMCVFVSLGGTPVAVQAEQGPPKPDDRPAAAPVTKNSPSIVFERQHMRVRFETDGTGTREMTMHVRANDDAGVRQAAQIPLVYAPSSNDLSITVLEVHKSDGRVIKVGADAAQDHAIQPFAQTPMFIDLRQKTVTIPALEPRDMVAITAIWKVARPFAGKHSWYEHSFVKHAVVNDERLEVDVPESVNPLIRAEPTAPSEENGGKGRVSGGRRIFIWQTSNLDVAKSSEDALEEAHPADVRITTFGDWAAFAGWLQPLMQPEADETVRAKAIALTNGLADPVAKVDALYNFVATQIRYVSLSFGLNRYAPHSPADVLKNQFGDCKDKHALLAAMLRIIGVRAVPVLVNTQRSISRDFPSPTEFDHVLTALPTTDDPSGWRWLDTTLEIAPAGLLSPSTRGRLALSLGDGRTSVRVVTTPEDGPFPFLETTTISGEVNPLGVLTADIRLTTRGDSELILRGALRAMPRESLKEFGENLAKALGFDGEVSGFAFKDPLGTRDPFELTFSLRKSGYLDWAAAEATLTTPTGALDTAGLDPDRTPLKADRKVRSSAALHRTLTLRLPPGYAATAPVGVKAAKDDFAYGSRYSVEGSVIRVERRLEGQPRTLLVAHAADYSRIARSIAADLAQTFKITRLTKTIPPVPDGMAPRELYAAGYSAFNAKDYDTAIAIWSRAEKADPKMTSVLNGLGWAYHRLKRYDEAAGALEKQRALDPTDKRINSDLGYVYEEAGRLEEAAEAYARHLATEPLDGPRHQTLGMVYAELDRHPEAIASFEKAVPLVKNDAWLHRELGRSFLAVGRVTQALAAFDTALKHSRTPAIEAAIAWSLAEHRVEPAMALELSTSAVASILKTMRNARAESLASEHFDLMERLAWAWEARGMVQIDRGQVDQAMASFESAWQLGATSEMALHLAQAYEKKERRADAASYYLTARALDATPEPELQAALKRYYPGADLEQLLDAASKHATLDRSANIEGKSDSPREARFNAVLDGQGRVIDVSFLDGDKALADFGSALAKARFRLTTVETDDLRIAARVRLACNTSTCLANVQAPRHVQ